MNREKLKRLNGMNTIRTKILKREQIYAYKAQWQISEKKHIYNYANNLKIINQRNQ